MNIVYEPYEPIETVHLYVVREKEKKPFVVLPLCAAVWCLSFIVGVTVYSGYHPTYEHATRSLPAHFLPLQTFKSTQAIIPTGIKTYPATTAHGILTLTNGSVIPQTLPAGFTSVSNSGVSVVTDTAMFVPAGNANGYGIATVPAHLLTAGINLSTLDIDQVVGTSLYIRNLDPFTGGKPAYSTKVITSQDKQAALDVARASLTLQQARTHAMLAAPCRESSLISQVVHLTWTCKFIAYPHLPGVQITATRLRGKNLLVDVMFIAPPKRVWVR
jgi:hypothetical protein